MPLCWQYLICFLINSLSIKNINNHDSSLTITFLTSEKYIEDPIIGKISLTIKNMVVKNHYYSHPYHSTLLYYH